MTVTTMRPFVATNRTRRKCFRAGGQGTMMMTPSAAGFSHNVEEALNYVCKRELKPSLLRRLDEAEKIPLSTKRFSLCFRMGTLANLLLF